MLTTLTNIKNKISDGSYDSLFKSLYDNVDSQKKRYLEAVSEFEKIFEGTDCFILSVPGRTEVAGNHTDHQRGAVLAASVSLDAIAIVSKRNDKKVHLRSKGYDKIFEIDLSDLSIHENEKETTESLIRGMAAGFVQKGYDIGGFDAYVQSDVLSGSGLSSSACFEVLIGTIFSYIYNNNSVEAYKIAMLGQYAENEYFGKPCGLMDQMACAIGGLIKIDFKDKETPDFGKIPFEPEKEGYRLCIVDTGGSHADLTDDYASVPADMKAVAKLLGYEVLRQGSEEELYANAVKIRNTLGDRALLRAFHFYKEMERVNNQREFLENNDFEGFLSIVNKAGESAVIYNQNAYTCKKPDEQGIVVGLMLCNAILQNKGAYRLQGGGFAGTIQAYVPSEILDEFTQKVEAVFGKGSVYALKVRQCGAAFLA